MKRSLPFLVLTLFASAAFAQTRPALSSETKKAVSAMVQDQLLKPLARAQSKRSRFSRMAPMPVVRRVRVTDDVTYTDARGRPFVRFAVDTHSARNEDGAWSNDAMSGCAYPNSGKVFVQSGDDFIPAANLLGSEQESQESACREAPVVAVVELAKSAT